MSAKEKLITEDISLRDRTVQFLDVEKTMTNVSIKDAPYELDNSYIATQMLKYGEVIPGSVRRAYIKYTHVENGSRYLQILNCIPTLPNITKFGRFEVRVLAENNITEGIHCGKKNHTRHTRADKNPLFKKYVLTVIIQGTSLGNVSMIQLALTVEKVFIRHMIVICTK